LPASALEQVIEQAKGVDMQQVLKELSEQEKSAQPS
jgi:hypothetical protein